MLFWMFVLGLLAFLLYGIHVYVLDKRYHLPPGPLPLPFIGNFYVVRPNTPFWRVIRNVSDKFGPVVTFYSGQIRMVALNDAAIIRETLVGQADIFSARIDTKLPGFEILPSAILSANGEVWRERRRFVIRALREFGMGKDKMVSNIQEEVSHLLPEIESYNGQPFNPRQLINNAVSNIICSLVFGRRFNYGDAEFKSILKELEGIVCLNPKSTIPFFMLPALKYFTSPGPIAHFMAFINRVTKMTVHEVAEHRKDFSPENIRDFPDLFIHCENKEDGIDFESFSLVMHDMFLAGTETTSTAIAWTLIYLSTYPEIQSRCHKVIDEVIDTARLPSIKDRPKLVYIDAVMCEVLRCASFIPLSLFHANFDRKDAKIAGYDIPPYTLIVYNLGALHRDPSYWKDPEVFNPDRWISPDDGKLLSHSTHFMPFGIGPRICLGEALAKAEYFIFVVSLLHRFRFSLKEPVDLVKERDGVIRAPPPFEIIAQLR